MSDHTFEDDFQHFLSYSGLRHVSNREAYLIRKTAEAMWRPAAILQWQPINSAPKNWTSILLHRSQKPIYTSCGEWTEHRGGYWTTDFFDSVTPEQLMAGQPTDWMPLPDGPRIKEES